MLSGSGLANQFECAGTGPVSFGVFSVVSCLRWVCVQPVAECRSREAAQAWSQECAIGS